MLHGTTVERKNPVSILELILQCSDALLLVPSAYIEERNLKREYCRGLFEGAGSVAG